MNYRKVNNLVGWITGAIAYLVFLKTMEPTASFWDCGEFLACAYKLEVGHSPGAPFFMMVQRIFGLLAGGNKAAAAWFINSESALTSGLTILFLFWTITHFAKKLLVPKGTTPDGRQTLLIMGAGLVGGLAYTFSDTFWFSAVEAEVYATSSFFTALTFWAILKWEDVADNKYSDRWLVLISYLIGISVCVHLLNLLTIPAVAMVYYYRRYEASVPGAIIAFLAGCVVLALVQFGIIQYVPILASKLDVAFVNNMGLPLDTGAITFLVFLVALLAWLLVFAKRKGYYLVHTAVLCIMFILIGYSSYIVPIIRSRADVPVDMTNPDNVVSFVSYVDREQFGQQPLLFGQDFTSRPDRAIDKGPMYYLNLKDGKAHYDVVGEKQDYHYEDVRFFPRIYDNNDPMHVNFYRSYLGLAQGETPTSADNMKYFWGYQMNWMWWRYFMWNYAGRENDVEGQGDPKNGNWVSGIKFLDQYRVGDMDKLPEGFVNNGARNELYFLPMILGLCGMVYQFNRKSKDGIVTLTLFFFTGAAIGIYLNMPPVQPRERDYAFAGCTYAFAIWIGLGVLMIEQYMARVAKGRVAAYLTIAICLLAVPVLMAKVEWNDHDRSNKTLARAVAYNALSSCAPNAILFTAGDNQTYPLWYLQEIEGFRPDVRIINTSLLGIDWYIDQLNYRINDADALPMVWPREAYLGERSNYITYFNNPQMQVPQDKYINLTDICKFISSSDNAQRLQTQGGDYANYFPTKKFFLPTLSKADLVKNGLANAEDTAMLNTEMKFMYPKDGATKSDITILNILAGIANTGWKRPMYFDAGLPTDNYEGLAEYLKLEGLVYRVMPYKSNDSAFKGQQLLGSVDLDKTLNLFNKTYIWGGADKNNVYFDEPNRREFMIYRMNAAFTANVLSAKGRNKDADSLLNKVYNGITEHSCYYDYTGYLMANSYYRAGDLVMGRKLTMKLLKTTEDELNWLQTVNEDQRGSVAGEINNDWEMIRALGGLAGAVKDSATINILNKRMEMMYPKIKPYLNMRGGGGGDQQ